MSLRKRPLRPFAWFALVAFLCGWMLPFFEAHPLGFDDDSACATSLVPTQTSPDQLSSADGSDRAPAHCMLCHLMRAMNGAVHVDVARLAVPMTTASPLLVAENSVRSIVLSSTCSRGPPAAFSI